MCALLQELEALRSQVQSQSTEINQLKTERQELLRRAEGGVKIMNTWSKVDINLLKLLGKLTSFSLASLRPLTHSPLVTAH